MNAKERMQCLPTEGEEQARLMNYCKVMQNIYEGQYPGLELIFHIPNGGKRSAREAAHFKAEGVQAGVPDLFLPVPRGKYHGLWIEMKRRKGGKVQESQKEWAKKLEGQGYASVVAHGADEAWEIIDSYYKLGEFGGVA